MKLMTVKQLAEVEPAFTENSLRFHVFHAEPRTTKDGEEVPPNGLKDAIKRIGRKVLINHERFLAWVEAQGGK